MTPQQQRNYMSPDGFSRLLQTIKGDQTQVDLTKLGILTPMESEIKTIGGKDSRLIEFIITSDRVDRQQDTLATDGWAFEDYEKNPVVLWAHDHYAMPIGNSRSLTRSGNKIKSICEFTPQELAGGFGYMVYQMYAEKFMHATSVGFQPLTYSYSADRKYGIDYLTQSLLEYSCVPVPANPDALAVARSKGIDTMPLKRWAEQVLDESRSGPTALSDDARRRMEVLRAASSPSGRALILELGDMKMTGTETPAPAPRATSTVKKVTTERWECGITGHVHEAEAEATACAEFDKTVIAFVTSIKSLVEIMKSGRKLSDAQKSEIQASFETLVPPAVEASNKEDDTAGDPGVFTTEETDASEDGEEKGLSFEISEEALRAAVTSAVDEQMKEVTGRVD